MCVKVIYTVCILLQVAAAAVYADTAYNNFKVPRTVFLDSGSSNSTFYAANLLASYLTNATGRTVSVTTTMPPTDVPYIAVGFGAVNPIVANKTMLTDLGLEGYVIASDPVVCGNGCILLSGGQDTERGDIYAVIGFLEKLGFQFLAEDETQIPALGSGTVFPAMHVRVVPDFEYRENNQWQQTLSGDWNVRARFNRGTGISDDKGSAVSYASPPGFVHTSYAILGGDRSPPKDLWDAHREWFWPRDDPTVYGQLCWTNQSLIAYMTDKVTTFLRAQPDANIISVSQNDNQNYCQDATEKAVIDAEGSPMGPLLRAVNQIADSIKPEFPNVAIDTLAYQYTRRPPTITKPRPNVIIRLCSIECNFAKPLSDPTNAPFQADMVGWGKICNRIYVWNYITNFHNYLCPFPDWFSIGPNTEFFVKHGVRGMFQEGAYNGPGADMQELKNFLTAQKLWNPKQDSQTLISTFLKGYYGPGAPYIQEYLDVMINATDATQYYMHESFDINAPFLTSAYLLAAGKALLQAREATVTFRINEERVNRVCLAVYYVVLQRWLEVKAFARAAGTPWPFENSITDAWEFFAVNFQATSAAGKGPIRFSEGSTNDLSWFKDQVFPKCQSGKYGLPLLPSSVIASSWWTAPPQLSGNWSSGNYPPAWISFGFANEEKISEITAVVMQVPSGNTTHTITADGKVITNWSGYTKIGDTLTANIAAPQAFTNISITTSESPSWVAWEKITFVCCPLESCHHF